MKISIVMSVYNGEKYITEQINSLLHQSRQADEVLIFDDCSNDHTYEIIQKFIEKNNLSKWILVSNKINKGWKRSFIEGMRCAAGELIFPCDQDDIWLPDKLEQMEKIMYNNSEIDLLVSDYIVCYDSGKEHISSISNGSVNRIELDKSFFDTQYPGCVYCVRQSFFKKVQKYWESDFPHDSILWRTAIVKGTLFHYAYPTIRWRRHYDSTYTIEARNSKQLSKKIEWIEYAYRCFMKLEEFLNQEVSSESEKARKLIEESRIWLDLRMKFFQKKRIIYGVKLLKYRGFYTSIKQYLGDWYLVFWKK